MEHDNTPFDQEIFNILETTFEKALQVNELGEGDKYTPDQIKLLIVATNLQSLANTFLIADSQPDEITMNLKQVALGILGTIDFIKEGIEE